MKYLFLYIFLKYNDQILNKKQKIVKKTKQSKFLRKEENLLYEIIQFLKIKNPDPDKSRPDPQHCLCVNLVLCTVKNPLWNL